MSTDQGRTLNKLSANNHIQPSRRIELVQVITKWQQHSYPNLPAFIYLCLTPCSSHKFRTTICLPFVLIEMHIQEERTWKHRSHDALTYHRVYVPNVLTNGVLYEVHASP